MILSRRSRSSYEQWQLTTSPVGVISRAGIDLVCIAVNEHAEKESTPGGVLSTGLAEANQYDSPRECGLRFTERLFTAVGRME